MLKGPQGKRRWWLLGGLALTLVMGYVLVLTFRPARRPRLAETEEAVLGRPGGLRGIGPGIEERREWPENPSYREREREEVKPEEPDPLDALAQVADAPVVLTAEEQAHAVRVLTERAGVAPEDVILDIRRQRETPAKIAGPVFLPRGDPMQETSTSLSAHPQISLDSLGEPAKHTSPRVHHWQPSWTGERFQPGQVFKAKLLTDVVATNASRRALVEVYHPRTGLAMGVALVSVRLAVGRGVAGGQRVELEGRDIVDREGVRLRGRFSAFSPDGSEGLVGRTRTHLLRHLGLTLYKTALGVFALRLAEQDNTLAGIIGAQTGTSILRDLAGETRLDRIPRTVMIPRGSIFLFLLVSPGTEGGSEGRLAGDPRAGAFDDALRVRNRRLQELADGLTRLAPEPREALGFEGALQDPAAWDQWLQGDPP